MLTFPITLFAGGAATRTFLQAETPQIASASTYTFTSVNLGTASSDRYVVVVIASGVLTPGRTLNSVTIGGNTATLDANANTSVAASSTTIVGIARLLVTSGTSANVVATFSGNMSVCHCFTYTLTGLVAAAPTATKTTSVTSGTVINDTINIPAGGIFLMAAAATTSTGSWTETGATEDADDGGGSSNNLPACCASIAGLAAETGRAYSATISANTPAMAMAAAAWH